MSIFEFSDYRVFLKDFFQKLPRNGRGKAQELAHHLRIHPTVVSQVFSGAREFSEEQALEICEFLQLSPVEEKYFRLLVRLSGASTPKLKQKIKAELADAKTAAKALSTRVVTEKPLTDTERAVFYSSWLYSAIRLYASTDKGGRTVDEIVERFGITRVRALEICDFLTGTGLCSVKNGAYQMGAQSTFVEKGSPFLMKHHSNWRLKAVQSLDNLSEDELMFTGAMSISAADFQRLRERMAEFIKAFSQTVKDSPAEEIACFNMDFFWIRK